MPCAGRGCNLRPVSDALRHLVQGITCQLIDLFAWVQEAGPASKGLTTRSTMIAASILGIVTISIRNEQSNVLLSGLSSIEKKRHSIRQVNQVLSEGWTLEEFLLFFLAGAFEESMD